MTPLDKSLKRTLNIKGRDFVVTLTPESLKITEKGHRLGSELKWEDLISGDSALAVALNASLGKFQSRASESKKPKVPPKTLTKIQRAQPKRKSPKRAR